jgi:hypothetical protein
VVGFALPLVALSGMGSFLPFEVALALLIVPTLVSNTFQALRNGVGSLGARLVKFWRLNLILVVMIALCAQLVVALPDAFLFALLGVRSPPSGSASSPAGGRGSRRRGGALGGDRPALVGGFFGGISGIWGPPIVMYLLAAEVPKVEMVRVQALVLPARLGGAAGGACGLGGAERGDAADVGLAWWCRRWRRCSGATGAGPARPGAVPDGDAGGARGGRDQPAAAGGDGLIAGRGRAG